MTGRLKSLRKAVWQDDKTGIGEALRDIHGFCSRLTQCAVVQVPDAVWSEPFSFSVEAQPQLVILADARQKGAAGNTQFNSLDWTTQIESGSMRVKVGRASDLVPGRVYSLKFLVVY